MVMFGPPMNAGPKNSISTAFSMPTASPLSDVVETSPAIVKLWCMWSVGVHMGISWLSLPQLQDPKELQN